MEAQAASLSSLSAPLKLDQNNFRRVSCTADTSPPPIPGLAGDSLHMRVKEGSKIQNLLRFAVTQMQGEGKGPDGMALRQVVFTGSGRGITKTITCAEILKRELGGLHQVSKLYYKQVNEVWESLHHGVPAVTLQKTVPAISILLSKDPLDPQEPGYQPPQTASTSSDDKERNGAVRRPLCCPFSHPRLCDAKRACLDDQSISSPSASSV